MKILVCGGRDYGRKKVNGIWRVNYTEVKDGYRALDKILKDQPINNFTIIHGAANGADTMAHRFVEYVMKRWPKHGYRAYARPVPADWDTYGKAAGTIRNKEMLKMNPYMVIAFKGGVGTAHMINIAYNAGIAVYVVKGRFYEKL